MNILPVSNAQKNQSFQGYVDKSVKNRIRYIATLEMRDAVVKSSAKGEAVNLEFLESIKTKALKIMDSLSEYMELVHPKTALKMVKDKEGRETLVLSNPISRRNIDYKDEAFSTRFYRTFADEECNRIDQVEKIADAITRIHENTVNKTFWRFAIEDLEPKTGLIPWLSKFFTKEKMALLAKYGEEIGIKDAKAQVQAHIDSANLKEARRIKEKLSETPEKKALEQKNWETFIKMSNELYPHRSSTKAADECLQSLT